MILTVPTYYYFIIFYTSTNYINKIFYFYNLLRFMVSHWVFGCIHVLGINLILRNRIVEVFTQYMAISKKSYITTILINT